MSATVIDQLVVELGLDPKSFKKTADSIGSSIVRLTSEFVGLFLVVRSVQDIVHFFADLNEQTRQLGIDSRNLGTSAAELRDWGNIAEMAGGNADDATKSITQLQTAIFNAQQGFGWSEQLTTFGRLGIDAIDRVTNKARDFKDILFDTAAALQNFSKPERFQWAQKLGLQGGIANAVVEGPQAMERYWQQQLKIHQVTDADTNAAIRLAQAWDLLKDKMRALATQILTSVSPAIQKLFASFSQFLERHKGDIAGAIDKMAEWAQGPGPGKIIDALVAIGDAAVSLAHAINDVADFIEHPFTAKTASASDVTAAQDTSGSHPWDTALGQIRTHALENKYQLPFHILEKLPPGGPSPEVEAQALQKIHAMVGGDAADPDWTKTLAEYRRRMKFTDAIKPNPGALRSTPKAAPSPAAAGSLNRSGANGTPVASNTVQIDHISVNTAATDAHGIAADMNRAVQRKFNVAQADNGMVS